MPWGEIALLLPMIFFVLADVMASLIVRHHRDDQMVGHSCDDFTVLVPIYGHVRYLANVGYLAQCSGDVVLCTTSGESEEFYESLEGIASFHGFQVFRSRYAPPLAGKRRTGGVIRDRVVRDALEQLSVAGKIRTFTVCIDADTTSVRPLSELVGELNASGRDFASVDLVPQSKGPLIVQMQRHEYRASMRLRYLMPWLLSGACHVGRSDVFRRVMATHSLFFQGNDMETGILADGLDYTSIHLPFKVDTEVPSRLRDWWRQRIAWGGGEFRIFIINFRLIWRHPILWLYGSVVTIGMVGMRWYGMLTTGTAVLNVFALYYVAMVWINWRDRNWWLLLQPFYAVFNSMVFPAIGIFWFFVMAIPERNFGIIRVKTARRSRLSVSADERKQLLRSGSGAPSGMEATVLTSQLERTDADPIAH